MSGLKYASVIPSQIFWQKAEYVRRFTTVSILCSIAGAGLLTLFFMRRNYSPIRQLVQVLSGGGKEQKAASNVNELGFIRNAVVHALSEKEQVEQQLQKQSLIVRSNTLNRLLKGKVDPHIPFDEALVKFNIHFKSDEFAVILFFAEEPEEPGPDDSEPDSLPADEKPLQLIMAGIIEELLASGHHAGYTTEMDDMSACIVNFSPDGGEPHEDELRRIAGEARRLLLERHGIRLALSCSGIHQSLEGIARACQEALDAMEYKLVMGKPEITFFGEIQTDGQAEEQLGYYYPLQVEHQLINFIKVGDFGKASTVLNEIADRNFNKPMASITLARCVMFNMISTMIKTMNEIGGTEESLLLKNPRWMEQIAACRTIKEMYEQLLALLKEVCDYASSQIASQVTHVKAESMRELAAEVMEFIHGHYQDYNLNVNMIGKEFEIKPSYLSQMFKNMTGEGMLDYIGRYRVMKAKEFMRAGQGLSVAEAARLAGFTETATFIRVFKKHEGITPGKYKELSC
ncbi:MAG: AraC family transcriptional regulator [Paenibacillaceae bacterium]|nr:AraC family transcriptional regulator [Paenibacillaceae bacterium]